MRAASNATSSSSTPSTTSATSPADPPCDTLPPARNAVLVGICNSKLAARLTARDESPAMVVDLADGRYAIWKLGVSR